MSGTAEIHDATEEATEQIRASGLVVLTRDAMRQTAAVWDEQKQWAALQGFKYYLRRIQKHEGILAEVRAWCLEQGILEPGTGAVTQAEAAAISDDDESAVDPHEMDEMDEMEDELEA